MTTIRKTKGRHLRPEIRYALDRIEMLAAILMGLYCYVRVFLFIVGIDL